ncbi:MAG: di-heme oxidoredictase family protein, partial [Actinomycetota bacterium]
VYGNKLQDRSVVGVPSEGELVVTYRDVPGEYGDGTPYALRAPDYEIIGNFGELGDDIMISPRLAPQVIGMGLLEAIPEADIRGTADPHDSDGDGISGRPNEVWSSGSSELALGRFGWKAGQPTVLEQSADAFRNDMGITSDLAPDETCTGAQTECAAAPTGRGDDGEQEVTASRLASVTFYTRTLAVPAGRGSDDPHVQRGAELFDEFNCSACHTPTYTTGPLEEVGVEALSDQVIFPYTDLLLHDMGPGLADDRPEFEADGQEWRTPPLWGIGLIEVVNGELFLLHDGRARTIEEAILWHGGEASAAMEAFRTADADDRAALVAFLESR